jgi:hypothetical protein
MLRIANRGVWVIFIAAKMLPDHSAQFLTTIRVWGPAGPTLGHPPSLVMHLDNVLM